MEIARGVVGDMEEKLHMESNDELAGEFSDDDEEESVIRIDSHRMRRGKKEYLVIWSKSDPSWQPREDLVDPDGTECMALIRYEIRLEMEARGNPHNNNNNNNQHHHNNTVVVPSTNDSPDAHALIAGAVGVRCQKCRDLQIPRPLTCSQCHHFIKAHGYVSLSELFCFFVSYLFLDRFVFSFVLAFFVFSFCSFSHFRREIDEGKKVIRLVHLHVCPVVDGKPFRCPSYSQCPTSSKGKHDEELKERKQDMKISLPKLGVDALRSMNSEERSRSLQTELLACQETRKIRLSVLDTNRNASLFSPNASPAVSPSPSPNPSPPRSPAVSLIIPSTPTAKRDFAEMNRQELELELEKLAREEAQLKKRKRTIEFHLSDFADGF